MPNRSQAEVIQFRIPSDPKYIATIRKAILSIAQGLGFPGKMAQDIELSVAEAMSNAVKHGSPESGRNIVVVSCKVETDNLTIDVRDEGYGFDVPDIAGEWQPFAENGRGLRMIYRLMDRVSLHHSATGSRIRMVKSKASDACARREVACR